MTYDLYEPILELSVHDNFGYACLEWELAGIDYHKDWTFCACGQRIKEACYIKNRLNGNIATVGNCCISQFPGQKDTLLALRALHDYRLNEELIDLVYEYDVINQREWEFLLDVWRKRKFTEKQKAWYLSLKARIFTAFGKDKYASHLRDYASDPLIFSMK